MNTQENNHPKVDMLFTLGCLIVFGMTSMSTFTFLLKDGATEYGLTMFLAFLIALSVTFITVMLVAWLFNIDNCRKAKKEEAHVARLEHVAEVIDEYVKAEEKEAPPKSKQETREERAKKSGHKFTFKKD